MSRDAETLRRRSRADVDEAAFGCPVKMVNDAAMQALHLDDVVLDGGNAKKRVPAGCRVAITGGFRLWEKKAEHS
jgi:hypothetical protein